MDGNLAHVVLPFLEDTDAVDAEAEGDARNDDTTAHGVENGTVNGIATTTHEADSTPIAAVSSTANAADSTPADTPAHAVRTNITRERTRSRGPRMPRIIRCVRCRRDAGLGILFGARWFFCETCHCWVREHVEPPE